MVKCLSICAALIALGTVPLGAQEREAVPQQTMTTSKLEVQGVDYDIIFVTAECDAGASCEPSCQPDPLAYGRFRTRVYLVPKGKPFVSAER
jgi:hypothetical protein